MLELPHLQPKLYNRRLLFLLLAALIFCWNISILWFSGQDLDLQIFQQLLLLGMAISLEDKLANLWPKPSRFSFFAGAILLALLLTLSPVLISVQGGYIKYLLLPGSICALALLGRPFQQLQLFAAPLLISLLLHIAGPLRCCHPPFKTGLQPCSPGPSSTGLAFRPA